MSHATRVGARRRLTQAAVLASVALGVSTVAAAGPASAESAPLTYSCTVLGNSTTMSTVIDTDLPARVVVGQSVPVKLTSTVTVPSDLTNLIYGFLGARTVSGTAVANGLVSGPAGQVRTVANLVVAPLPVPETGPGTVKASGSSTPFRATVPGVYTVTAGDYTTKLHFANADGDPAGGDFADQTIPCKAPTSGSTVVDKVTAVKAASTSVSSAKVKKGKATLRSRVSGQYGNDPSGKVTFVVKKGKKKVAKATSKLNGANVAQTAIKKALKKGSYTLTTTYAGNGNLNPSTDVVRFRVR